MDFLGLPTDQPVFVIESQDSAGAIVQVELRDASLPDRGLSTPVEHRIVKSTPVGAAAPIVQRVGFVLQPFTIGGSFDDAAMAVTGGAEELSGRLFRMAVAGRQVTLAYSDKWTMEGFIRRYSPSFHENGRISWALEFDPIACSMVGVAPRGGRAQYVRSSADIQRDAIRAVAIATAIRGVRQSVTRTAILATLVVG